MRRVLALASLVAAMPLANAQDKSKAEFTPSAEYRPRYFFMQNPGATSKANSHDSFAEHRFKAGLNYKANERLSGHMTLLHAADFGADTGAVGATNATEANAIYDRGNQENFLNVNEAYLNWMVSDDFSVRIGRMNFQIADGTVFAYNDWEQNPGAFDGIAGTWEAEFGRFTGFVFNYKERSASTATPAGSTDPKHTAYGLSFDLKSMPDFMKMVNVHVIQDNNDAVTAASGSTVGSDVGQNTLRYGLGLGFDFGIIDLKGHYAGQSGEYKSIAATTGVKTKTDAKGMMWQAELGLKLEAFMASRLYALYHVDSGDKSGTDGDAGRYDSYFNEKHGAAGLMDLFGWGNLTKMTVGWTGKPGDRTDIGLSYNMFSKTEKNDGFVAGRFGTALGAGAGTGDKLGDEIDVWAEHRYEGNLSTLVRAGYFMPGDVLKAAGSDRKDAIMHIALEGKVTF